MIKKTKYTVLACLCSTLMLPLSMASDIRDEMPCANRPITQVDFATLSNALSTVQVQAIPGFIDIVEPHLARFCAAERAVLLNTILAITDGERAGMITATSPFLNGKSVADCVAIINCVQTLQPMDYHTVLAALVPFVDRVGAVDLPEIMRIVSNVPNETFVDPAGAAGTVENRRTAVVQGIFRLYDAGAGVNF